MDNRTISQLSSAVARHIGEAKVRLKTAVIIPVYNQERFLEDALRSLSAQTSRDFVAICVDDGSTDRSPAILEQWRTVLPVEMKTVRQENSGVSAARNAGLDVALSRRNVESVMFLDPDDLYEPACVENARALLAEHPGCVGAFDFQMGDSGRVVCGRDVPCVWNKIYPRSVVEDVRFCEGTNVAEDLAFNLEVLHRHAPLQAYAAKVLYRYREVPGSTMHRPLKKVDIERRLTTLSYLTGLFSDDPRALDSLCRKEVPELLKQFWRDLRRVAPDDADVSRRLFERAVGELAARGLLHPKRGSVKDLKYFLRFWLMGLGGRR